MKKLKHQNLNQYQKSDKAFFIIYAHLKCLIEKTDECKNNPQNLLTTRARKETKSKTKTTKSNV